MVIVVASITAFLDEPVGSEQAQMLRNPWPGQSENLDQRVDVFFSRAQFLNQTYAIGVCDDFEKLRQFLRNYLTTRHFFFPRQCLHVIKY